MRLYYTMSLLEKTNDFIIMLNSVNTSMDIILQLIQDNPWFGVVTAGIAFASAITAATSTPKEGSIWSKIYSIIDWAALNIGKAKQK